MLYKYAIGNLVISIVETLLTICVVAAPFIGLSGTTKYNYFFSGVCFTSLFFYNWKEIGKSYAAFCEARRNRNDR